MIDVTHRVVTLRPEHRFVPGLLDPSKGAETLTLTEAAGITGFVRENITRSTTTNREGLRRVPPAKKATGFGIGGDRIGGEITEADKKKVEEQNKKWLAEQREKDEEERRKIEHRF